MAQRTTVTLVDDIDGSEADETLTFGLDGVDYEVDLSTRNANTLRGILADYVAHARRQGRTSRSRPRAVAPTTRAATGPKAPSSASVDREQNKAIRTWARQHGYTVSERGRIPSEVSEAYHRAS